MVTAKNVVRFFVFLASGLAAIIVGLFMLRGTMHLWDKPKDDKDGSKMSTD